jgi:PTS system nitrogen regulatory IIA component
MGISDRISAADVMLDLSVRNKRDLLELMARKAAIPLGRSEAEILDALSAREELGSTALGKGVAVPHAQIPGDVPGLMLLARLRRPIEFDAPDAEPVDLVFLVLWSADDPKGLLAAVGEICRRLRDPEVLRRLRLATRPQDVSAVLDDPGEPDPLNRPSR